MANLTLAVGLLTEGAQGTHPLYLIHASSSLLLLQVLEGP